ncbi:hypothetical protein [uncultured Legionella sp.]|uniref:hypothetical protein n=1 Tax=uncultured Legionella sp. TaxID=210934 RepID=UPI002639C0A7|nr:hypothetical protein [uncultured Legionella sp.]
MFQRFFTESLIKPMVMNTGEAVATAVVGTTIYQTTQAVKRVINGESPEIAKTAEHAIVSADTHHERDEKNNPTHFI